MGAKIDRPEPSWGKYKLFLKKQKLYTTLMKELPAVWPEYPSREVFDSDQSSYVEYNKEVHGQLISFVKDEWEEKEEVTVDAASAIFEAAAEKFGFSREETQISVPEINNDLFHPLLNTFKNPEEVWDMVEGLDFPPTLANALPKNIFSFNIWDITTVS